MIFRRTNQLTATALAHLPHHKLLFLILCGILFASILGAAIAENLAFLALAPIALGGLLAITNFRAVYLLMWACIPLSTELDFAGNFSTDFPAEALMVVLTGVSVLWTAQRIGKLALRIFFHPVTLFLLLHVGWIAWTVIGSTDPWVSFKFLLAKIWYVIPFFFVSYVLLRNEKEIKAWFFALFIPLLLTIFIILFRHGMVGFRFEFVNMVLNPFYRNHVDYALIMGVFFPFIVVMYDRWFRRNIGIAVCALMLLAVYLTFTRAAYLGLAISAVGILLVRWRIVRYVLLAILVTAGIGLFQLSKDNKYIDYAPNYYKTITHYKFGNLIEATYRFEDVSTMERFYRWIAAFYMVQEKPVTGFGPNNFVDYYKPYTDQHFRTYVSDNPEKSGVHNYFLMTTVEQGIPGLIIFLALLIVTLLRSEWLYHQLKPGFHRKLLTAVIGSQFFILFALLLNDMIETDKVGSFFFLNLAFVVIIERNARNAGDLIHIENDDERQLSAHGRST